MKHFETFFDHPKMLKNAKNIVQKCPPSPKMSTHSKLMHSKESNLLVRKKSL